MMTFLLSKKQVLSKLVRKSSANVIQALTHKSYHNENKESSIGHNERLEFLGDSVLEMVLSDILFNQFIGFSEGRLSKLRSALVNESTLNEIALYYEIDKVLHLGVGEIKTGGMNKPRLLASALEALIGAAYIDLGLKKTTDIIQVLFKPYLSKIEVEGEGSFDPKTQLQELTQNHYKKTPIYKVEKTEGPEHEKIFFVTVKINGTLLAEGEGKSKKIAEQMAAFKALTFLEKELNNDES
jgi:ribonuclease-3